MLGNLLKNGIDPKWMIVLVGLIDVQKGIGAGAVSLTNMIPNDWIPHVMAWNTGLAWVGIQLVGVLAALSSNAAGPLVKVPELPEVAKTAAKVVAVGIALALLAPIGSAQAQARKPAAAADPFKQFGDKVKSDFDNANKQVQSAVTGQPADPAAALPCMDIRMLPRLTLANLVPTMKACVQDANNQLVSDTQRALDSAKAFTGSATGAGTAVGDNDAINCLTPALALFKAAAIIPSQPEIPAVMNPDGTVKTPAVAAVPEQDPGPILLGQKFREFTLAGGLTSCQAWINEPVQAVAAAGAGAIASAATAVVLAPK